MRHDRASPKALLLIAFLSCGILAAQTEYRVKRGDTLYGIARSFGLPLSEILKANGLKETDRLVEGKTLRIPAAGSPAPPKGGTRAYVVKSGDSLYGIARALDIDLGEILRLNKIEKDAKLKIGQKLIVPDSALRDSPAVTPARTQASPKPMATAAPGTLTPSKVNPGTWPIPGTPAEMTGKLRGVEIQGKEGDPVRSISKGKVMATGPYRGFSQVVIVERDEKIIYIYGGQGRIFVAPGDIIQAGTILGELGMDSKAGKALMYFVVYVNGKAIDPANAPRD